jgi:hypothetical protein
MSAAVFLLTAGLAHSLGIVDQVKPAVLRPGVRARHGVATTVEVDRRLPRLPAVSGTQRHKRLRQEITAAIGEAVAPTHLVRDCAASVGDGWLYVPNFTLVRGPTGPIRESSRTVGLWGSVVV